LICENMSDLENDNGVGGTKETSVSVDGEEREKSASDKSKSLLRPKAKIAAERMVEYRKKKLAKAIESGNVEELKAKAREQMAKSRAKWSDERKKEEQQEHTERRNRD
jgi:hypothetical protein